MKARLISQETVYLYHIGLNSQRGQEITQALGEISVQVKEIKEEQLGETLGYCLGLPGFSKNDSPLAEEGFDQEVLVMKGFTRQSMDRMLKQFQRKGVPPVALKAVLTEHNSKWRCIDFFPGTGAGAYVYERLSESAAPGACGGGNSGSVTGSPPGSFARQ